MVRTAGFRGQLGMLRCGCGLRNFSITSAARTARSLQDNLGASYLRAPTSREMIRGRDLRGPGG